MKLEEIAKQYGMNDYYDMYTGNVYKLSEAIDNKDGTLTIPVIFNSRLAGYVQMEKVN